MTLQQAAENLGSDVSAAENLLRCAGYPPLATLLGTGVVGEGTGIFLRFNALGEEYVFTVTGNPTMIERVLNATHNRLSPHLARLTPIVCPPGGGTAAGEDHDTFIGREMDPRPRRNEDRSALHQHTLSIQRRPDGLWTACVAIPVQGGPLYLCATADEHAIAQALHGELAAVSGNRSWVGSDAYRSTAGQIAEARVFDRLGAALRNMVKDPGVQAVFSSVVPMVPFVGPPASLAFQGTKLAMELEEKASKGDPKARQAVVRIATQAKQGDVKAKRALDALKLAKRLKKADKREQQIILLQAERDDLAAKLKACQEAASAKWEETPKEAAEEFIDQWGGSEEYVGVDLIHGVGEVIGKTAGELGASRQLARPMIAHYFRERVPVGPVSHSNQPEVGALYHRPMREASDVAIRRDYLRGEALLRSGIPTQRRYLSWPSR